MLVKLNSNWAAMSLFSAAMEWERTSRDKHCLPSLKKKKVKTVYIADKNLWWLGIFSMTADKLQHNSSRTHKVSEKNLAFELLIRICSLCPFHNCSHLKNVHLQTGISGPSCLGSGDFRPLKEKADSFLSGVCVLKAKWFQGQIQVGSYWTSLVMAASRGSKCWLAMMSYMVNLCLHTSIFPCTFPWGKGKFSNRKLITATTSGLFQKPARLCEFNW